MLEVERYFEKMPTLPLQARPLFVLCPLSGPYHQNHHGGPQNASSSRREGVRGVFTIKTESGELGRAPIPTFFQSPQCPRGALVRETSF
jgi:hypothetical protein